MAPKSKNEKLNIYTGPQGSEAEKAKKPSIKANATIKPQMKTTVMSKTTPTKLAQIWDPEGTKVIKKTQKANIYTGPQGKTEQQK
jgi:hypothetical protein